MSATSGIVSEQLPVLLRAQVRAAERAHRDTAEPHGEGRRRQIDDTMSESVARAAGRRLQGAVEGLLQLDYDPEGSVLSLTAPLAYFRRVQTRCEGEGRLELYEESLDLMNSFNDGDLERPALLSRLCQMFGAMDDLILDGIGDDENVEWHECLNNFLPGGEEISPRDMAANASTARDAPLNASTARELLEALFDRADNTGSYDDPAAGGNNDNNDDDDNDDDNDDGAAAAAFLQQMATHGWAVVSVHTAGSQAHEEDLEQWHGGATRPEFATLEPEVDGRTHVTFSHEKAGALAAQLPQCAALCLKSAQLVADLVAALHPEQSPANRQWMCMGLSDETDRSIVSSFRYPARAAGTVLCPGHVDKGVLTLVTAGATLQVRGQSGAWVSPLATTNSSDDALVVFGGTTLEYFSGGRYPVVEHRVVSDGSARNAIVIKVRARDCCVVGTGGAYPPVQVAELMRRFDASHASVNSPPAPAGPPTAVAPRTIPTPAQDNPLPPGTITLRVKDQTGEETFFRIKIHCRMERIFTLYARQKGVAMHSLRFYIDGERINPDHTPNMLDLEDQDQIDCMPEQSGD